MRSKYELKAHKSLENQGYFLDFKIRPSRTMKNSPVDYFHLGDLLAVKQDEFRFISIKGKSCPRQHKNDLQTFANIVPPQVSVELWEYKKSGLKITKYEHHTHASSVLS